jgi:hypothetical protein
MGESILEPLELIFKKSFQETTLSMVWKLATVTPVYIRGTRKTLKITGTD